MLALSKDFIQTIQRYVAVTAIGPSALRNQGNIGVIDAARNFLSDINLAEFKCKTEKVFCTLLDKKTYELRLAFPRKAQNWGAARKAMNLFLRDALYNRYLAENFHLSSIEDWLEIPLDSQVANQLVQEEKVIKLAPWPGLKRLELDISNQYQSSARRLALIKGVARVHLDIYFWPKKEEE